MFTKQNEKSKCGLSNPNTEEGVFFQGGMQDELFGKTSGQPILRNCSPNTSEEVSALRLHRLVNSPKVKERKRDKENLVIQLETSSDSWKRSFFTRSIAVLIKNKSFYYPIPEYCSEYLVINNWPNYKVDVRSIIHSELRDRP